MSVLNQSGPGYIFNSELGACSSHGWQIFQGSSGQDTEWLKLVIFGFSPLKVYKYLFCYEFLLKFKILTNLNQNFS
jgi:hypothetical protein